MFSKNTNWRQTYVHCWPAIYCLLFTAKRNGVWQERYVGYKGVLPGKKRKCNTLLVTWSRVLPLQCKWAPVCHIIGYFDLFFSSSPVHDLSLACWRKRATKASGIQMPSQGITDAPNQVVQGRVVNTGHSWGVTLSHHHRRCPSVHGQKVPCHKGGVPHNFWPSGRGRRNLPVHGRE